MAVDQPDLRRRAKGEPEGTANGAGSLPDSEKDEFLVEARIGDSGAWDLFGGKPTVTWKVKPNMSMHAERDARCARTSGRRCAGNDESESFHFKFLCMLRQKCV
jgi:hypothetical protein